MNDKFPTVEERLDTAYEEMDAIAEALGFFEIEDVTAKQMIALIKTRYAEADKRIAEEVAENKRLRKALEAEYAFWTNPYRKVSWNVDWITPDEHAQKIADALRIGDDDE